MVLDTNKALLFLKKKNVDEKSFKKISGLFDRAIATLKSDDENSKSLVPLLLLRDVQRVMKDELKCHREIMIHLLNQNGPPAIHPPAPAPIHPSPPVFGSPGFHFVPPPSTHLPTEPLPVYQYYQPPVCGSLENAPMFVEPSVIIDKKPSKPRKRKEQEIGEMKVKKQKINRESKPDI